MCSLRFEKEIVNLRIENIKPNKNQPRKFFDEDNLLQLAQSIKENGILQPITVRICNNSFELVSGERRLRACKKIGLSHIPTIIVKTNDENSAILALIENLQRSDLNFFEEAESYLKIIKTQNLTQEQFAKKIGKSQGSVGNKLRLLKLSQKVRNLLISNNLTERHGRAILKLDDENLQLKVLEEVLKNDLNIKNTEKLVDEFLNKKELQKRSATIYRAVKDISILTDAIDEVLEFINVSKKIAKYKINQRENKYEIVIDVDLN